MKNEKATGSTVDAHGSVPALARHSSTGTRNTKYDLCGLKEPIQHVHQTAGGMQGTTTVPAHSSGIDHDVVVRSACVGLVTFDALRAVLLPAVTSFAINMIEGILVTPAVVRWRVTPHPVEPMFMKDLMLSREPDPLMNMKMLIRRLTVFSLCLVVVFSAGCGGEEDSSSSATPDTKAEIKRQAQSLSGEIRAMLAPADVRITEVRQTLLARRSDVEPELQKKLQELELLRDSLDRDLKRLTDEDVNVSESERERMHQRLDTFQQSLRETYLRSIQRRGDFYKAVKDRLDELTSRINRMELELEEAESASEASYWKRIAELREQRKTLSDQLDKLPSGAEKGYREDKREIASDVTEFGLEVDRAADSLYAALAAKGKLTREPS